VTLNSEHPFGEGVIYHACASKLLVNTDLHTKFVLPVPSHIPKKWWGIKI